MRLRIGIVSQSYHPAVGGVTEHVDATARVLRARGHEVTIVTSRFPGDGHAEPGGGCVGVDRSLGGYRSCIRVGGR
jgi:glycogen synthase